MPRSSPSRMHRRVGPTTNLPRAPVRESQPSPRCRRRGRSPGESGVVVSENLVGAPGVVYRQTAVLETQPVKARDDVDLWLPQAFKALSQGVCDRLGD